MKQNPLLSALALSYGVGMLVCFPLLIHRYYDGSSIKFSAYFVFSLLYLAAALLLWGAARLQKHAPARFSARTAALLLAAFSAAVSTLASPAPISAFWGLDGYLGGACLFLFAVFGSLLLSAALPVACIPTLGALFVGCGAGVSALGILNDFGLDPFHLYEYTNPTQYMQFFSTIGNIDYLNAFVCLWLPLACWNYLAAPRRSAKTLGWLAAAALGFFGMALLDTGLATIGVGAALLVCLFCVPLARWQYPPLLYLAAAWLGAQGLAARAAGLWALQRTERIFAGLPVLPAVIVAAILLVCGIILQARLPRGGGTARCMALQRGMALAVLLLLAAAFWACNAHVADFGALSNFFYLDAAWGSERGAIYADMLHIFSAAPPLRKLFGYGMGMVATLMNWASNLPYPLWDVFGAHSEYLEALLATGLAGLAAWLAVLGTHLIPALQAKHRTDAGTGWVLCLAAYSVQAAFNNRVVAVFPLFMAVIGVVGAILRREEAPCKPPRGVAPAVAAALLLPCCAGLGYLLFQPFLF
ncbi:MAG: O-antigen ligase family protein [Pygmaiobacter sp.]|nr:O-antigen ligase family protein [Pygmaiobacter sp.]